MTTFKSMNLIAPLQRALNELNYEKPTPIQAKTIPDALTGSDILGCAQTGTGKTAAFALPTLDYLGQEKLRTKPNRPFVLALAPTRELAIQIGDSFAEYGKYLSVKQTLVYGGVGQGKQVAALNRGVHVLIATPGRLVDLMNQRHIDLSQIEIFILDEADRMMDMGFLPQLNRIIERLPRERQSLFFSATMPPKIRELAKDLLYKPKSINVTPEKPSVAGITQKIFMVERNEKMDKILDLLETDDVKSGIVFTRTKRGANVLARKLDGAGYLTAAIHGNKSQAARQRALEAFRKNNINLLIATDVASRGIDIDGVTHVINYDMPNEAESYVHRIGRTGRAGATGIAYSFCTAEDHEMLVEIEKLTRKKLSIDNPERRKRAESSGSSGGGSRGRSGGGGGGGRGRSSSRSGRPSSGGGRSRTSTRKTSSKVSSGSDSTSRSSTKRTAKKKTSNASNSISRSKTTKKRSSSSSPRAKSRRPLSSSSGGSTRSPRKKSTKKRG